MEQTIQELSTDQLQAIAREYAKSLGATPEYITPYQQCQIKHAGQCGGCAQDGTFTGC